MLGLIKKDLFLIKGNLKATGIILIVFIGLAIFGNINLAFLPVFISFVLFMSTFSYDEYNKWDSYAITLPNGRNNVVKAKYATTLILLIVSTVIVTILSILLGIVKNEFDIKEIISATIGSIVAIILLISITYPIIFKFGNEKGRIAMFIIIFLSSSIFAFLFKSVKISKDMISLLEQYGVFAFIILSIILLFGSYQLSKNIYQKKEF